MIASSVADSMTRILGVSELRDRTKQLDAIKSEIGLADDRLRALIMEYTDARDDLHRVRIIRSREHTLQWMAVLMNALTEVLGTHTA